MSTAFTQETVTPAGQRLAGWLARQWLTIVIGLLLFWNGLPFLAPVFMVQGWTRAGQLIYLLYATQCHQLPQRSFFLFGPQTMYTLTEIQQVWRDTTNPLELRRFVGSEALGWKVAWSDRMVYMYVSLTLFVILYAWLRRRWPAFSVWYLILLLLPLALDGTSHMISDMFYGIGGGFRDHNSWLAFLTGNMLPISFYVGDQLGSFNAWMRLVSGLLFSLGLVGFIMPRVDPAQAQGGES